MKKTDIIFIILSLLIGRPAFSQTDIVPENSGIVKLSTNQFSFVEGPVWYEDSLLYFTDLGASKIYQYSPATKKFTFVTNSNAANGLTCDPSGALLACEQSKKRVARLNRQGVLLNTLATTYNSKTFNSPNDLVADKKGGVYFTDPSFGGTVSQDKEAVYYLKPDGTVVRIISDVTKPNGVILSPDGSRLYVADTYGMDFYSWDVAEDGSISNKTTAGTLQIKTGSGETSWADGMAVDIHGNIYIATELGIQVFSPSGQRLVTISVPEKPTNCDFGGKDMKTLYITAGKNLYSIGLNYPGFAVWKDGATGHNATGTTNQVLNIYPNPSGEMVYVQSEMEGSGLLDFYNAGGQKVYSHICCSGLNSIPVGGLPSGVYFLKLNHSGTSREYQLNSLVIH